MKFYIIGIKGTGLSAMACLLSDLGFKVKGCDVTRYIFTQEKLIKKGIEFEDIYNMNYQEYDYIIIAITYENIRNQVKKELVKMGVPEDKFSEIDISLMDELHLPLKINNF